MSDETIVEAIPVDDYAEVQFNMKVGVDQPIRDYVCVMVEIEGKKYLARYTVEQACGFAVGLNKAIQMLVTIQRERAVRLFNNVTDVDSQ